VSRRPAWLDERSDAPLRRVALLPLAAAAALYGLGARTHRAVYRSGWRRVARLPCAVVSVGALSAGGSGKTPVAAALAAGLRARGERVALASRGYGRAGGAEIELVSDGKALRSDVRRAGDEPLLLAETAPGVPVLVARDRAKAGRRAVAEFGTRVLVLDDGFQHHRLARDLDIVVLDGFEGLGNGAVLPRGPLREPPAALRFAHAIAVFDGPLPAADDARVDALAPGAPRFALRRVPRALRRLGDPTSEAGTPGSPLRESDPGEALPSALAGREVGLLSGLARPASFRRTVEALGARVVAERRFPDHHAYRAGDLAGLAAAAPLWLTTEKDAVKLEPAWAGGAQLRVLALAIEGVEPLVEFVVSRLGEMRS
jgi:tetraacyldisaccharide 4'-kinase